MRTLKKVLALTVVLATLLSISAFAAFSDEESINENFVDAVNLLGALNVMTGDTEGTFRPNDTISRAEAAKMIYVIRNGGVDDKAEGWTGMSTFSDVTPGVWYEGYVNYCASLNIIAGIGGGLFNPSGAVTGVELAKMMLVVADYRPDIEGYTGAGWNLNVIRDAQSAGMFKGYTLAYSAAATREQAAQLFSNAILETQMAVYIGDTRVNDLALITNTGTIGGRFFGLFTVTGILTKVQHVDLPLTYGLNDTTAQNDTSSLNANDNFSQISNIEVTNDTQNNTNRRVVDTTFEFAADPDLLYQEVDVIFREDTEDPGVLSRDSKVYAVLPTGNTYVYDTTMDAITIDLKDDSMDAQTDPDQDDYNPLTIQFEGYNGGRAKTLPDGFTLPVVTNLYEGNEFVANTAAGHAATASWDRDVWVLNAHDTEMIATTSTAPIRLIDYDRDGELDVAFVTTPYYGTVSSYNADRYEFSTDATIAGEDITTGRRQAEFENFTFEDDLEKDDVIAINLDVTTGELLYNVSLVEPTVGDVTYVYSTDPDNEVVIGGETYGFYGLLFNGKYLEPDLSADNYAAAYEDEVTVYTDGKYIISAYVEPADLGSKFAFVKNYNTQGNSFDLMPTDSQALLIELVLPNGDTVVKEYDREEVSSSTTAFYENDELAKGGNATNLLKAMLGNIVEYSTDGNYVAIRKVHNTLTTDTELQPNYYNVDRTYTYNSKTGVFTAANNRGVDVNDESVLFLPTYKEGATKETLKQGDITKVDVILGVNLRGEPTVTTVNDNDNIMQMVSCMKNGVNTVAFAALDADSTISDAGVFAYALTNDWDKDDGEEDEQQVRAVLSNSGSDEGAVVSLNNSGIIANKIYRAVLDSDGDYTFEEILNGETEGNATVRFGAIRGRNGNNISIGGSLMTDEGDVFHVTEETVIFVVDIDARGSMTRINLGDVSDLGEAKTYDASNPADNEDDHYFLNVLYETDPNNELTVVFVESVSDDLTPVLNYREQTSASATMPTLTMGMEQDEVDKAIKDAFPASFDVEITWPNGEEFPVKGTETYAPTITLTPKDGTTIEEKDGVFTVTLTIGENEVEIPCNIEDNKVVIDLSQEGVDLETVLNQITTGNVTKTLEVADVNMIESNPNDNGAKERSLTQGAITNVKMDKVVVEWYDASGTLLSAKPSAGDTVEVRFTLTAADNCQFAKDFKLKEIVNAADIKLSFNKDRTEVEVSALATVANPIILNGDVFAATLENGTSLASNVTVSDSKNLEVTAVEWVGDEDADKKADWGETLSVKATLGVKAGQTFSFEGMEASDFTVGVKGYDVRGLVHNGRLGASVTLTISAPAVKATTLNKMTRITLTAAALANGDELPATATVTGPATGIGTVSVSWTGDTNGNGKADTGETLVGTIKVQAGDGYVFDSTIANTDVTVNTGFTVSSGNVSVSEDGKTLTVTAEVEVGDADAKVDTIAVTGLTAPKTGDPLTKQDDVTVLAGVTITAFQWKDEIKDIEAGTNAAANTNYTLTITFTAEDGYVIDTTALDIDDVTGTAGTVEFKGTPTAESVTVVVTYSKTGV